MAIDTDAGRARVVYYLRVGVVLAVAVIAIKFLVWPSGEDGSETPAEGVTAAPAPPAPSAAPEFASDAMSRFPIVVTGPGVSEERWGYIDRRGEVVIAPTFEKAERFSEELAAVRQDGRWGFIDIHGTWVIQPRYRNADPFIDGKARVWTFEGYRRPCIDRTGAEVAPHPDVPHETRLTFDCEEEVGCTFYDSAGAAGSLRFGDGRLFAEGLAAAEYGGRWGFLDASGAFVLEPMWTAAREFSDGLAPVRAPDAGGEVGTWGYIDRTGRYVIEPMFTGAAPFANGLACVTDTDPGGSVELGRCDGYIDTSGRYVWHRDGAASGA